MSDQLSDVRDRLSRHGIRLDPPEYLPGGHLRVTARHGHRAVPYVIPATGSDRRGVLNAVADIRRLLRSSPDASAAPAPAPAFADTREPADSHNPARSLLGRVEPKARPGRPIWQPPGASALLGPATPPEEAFEDMVARAMARRMREQFTPMPLRALCRGIARFMGAPERLLRHFDTMEQRRALQLVQALGIVSLGWLEHRKGIAPPSTPGWSTTPMRGVSIGTLGMPRAQALEGRVTGDEPIVVTGRAAAVRAMRPPVRNPWPDCPDDAMAVIDHTGMVHVLDKDEKFRVEQMFGHVLKELTDGSLMHTSVLHDKELAIHA